MHLNREFLMHPLVVFTDHVDYIVEQYECSKLMPTQLQQFRKHQVDL